MADGLKFSAETAETTSEQDLDLPGFDGTRMVTFEYDDGTFAVDVVAVFGGQRLRANMTREGVPEEQARGGVLLQLAPAHLLRRALGTTARAPDAGCPS